MPSDLATIALDRRDGVRVASLAGEIDQSNATWIGHQLVAEAGDDTLVVDLSPLGYIDSAGIAMLANVVGQLGEERIRLVVTSASVVSRTLALACVDAILPLADSIDAAIAAIVRR